MFLNCKNRHTTISVCPLPERQPVLQVFSNLLPWYSSTAQLCLLLPLSGALPPRTLFSHKGHRTHSTRFFRRRECRSSEQSLFAIIISYSQQNKRKAGIYYLAEIRIYWGSWHPFLALPPRGSSVCRYAKPRVIEWAKRQELTQSLVWRLKYLHKEP